MRKFLTIPCLLVAILATAADFTDSVLARVGDKVITSYDVRMATAQDEAALPSNMTLQERMKAVEELRATALDDLILDELVWMDFQELKAKIPRDYLQERVDEIIQNRANANEERFRDLLHRDNLTYKDFEENVARQLAIDMLLYDRTKRNIFITNEQIEAYFQEHRRDYAQPTRFHIQAIQLPKTDDWQTVSAEIRSKLAQGADFGDLARKYSKGANAEDGGDMGWLSSMAPALEKAIRPLRVGNVIPNDLEIGNSVYIVRLLGREGGKAVQLTTDIQNKIKKILEAKESDRKRQEYLQTLTMKYPVRRY